MVKAKESEQAAARAKLGPQRFPRLLDELTGYDPPAPGAASVTSTVLPAMPPASITAAASSVRTDAGSIGSTATSTGAPVAPAAHAVAAAPAADLGCWTCATCRHCEGGLAASNTCSSCKADVWICKNAEFHQDIVALGNLVSDYCAECFSPPPKKRAVAKLRAKPKPWVCVTCSLSNGKELVSCSSCGDAYQGFEADSWMCAVCDQLQASCQTGCICCSAAYWICANTDTHAGNLRIRNRLNSSCTGCSFGLYRLLCSICGHFFNSNASDNQYCSSDCSSTGQLRGNKSAAVNQPGRRQMRSNVVLPKDYFRNATYGLQNPGFCSYFFVATYSTNNITISSQIFAVG